MTFALERSAQKDSKVDSLSGVLLVFLSKSDRRQDVRARDHKRAMKRLPVISNWSEFRPLGRKACLIGKITNHPRQDEFKAELQVTSPVLYYWTDKATGWDVAQTQNTAYRLGQRVDAD